MNDLIEYIENQIENKQEYTEKYMTKIIACMEE